MIEFMPSIPILTENYHIRAYQVDKQGDMQLAALCGLLQEIAGQHARKLGWGYYDLKAQNRTWILSRLGLKIHQLPRWQSDITIDTWVRASDRLFSYRDFEIKDSSANVLVGASTAWLMLDTKSRRLQRVDVIKESFVHLNDKAALDKEVSKLVAPKEKIASRPFRVQYSDLDVVGHANNIRYIQWILDSYPISRLENDQVTSFEINYLSEALYDNELVVESDISTEKHLHEIIRVEDGKTLCRAMIKWK